MYRPMTTDLCAISEFYLCYLPLVGRLGQLRALTQEEGRLGQAATRRKPHHHHYLLQLINIFLKVNCFL